MQSDAQVYWVERDNTAAALGEFERLTTLDCFLTTHLVLVVLSEVADDDWDWESNDQYATYTASGADHLTDRPE